MTNFDDKFQRYSSAVYPAMYALLAESLGVSVEACETINIGFDYLRQAWVAPERNTVGDITGLAYRYDSGKKSMSPDGGNKRGLVYPFNQEYCKGKKRYAPGRHNWRRTNDVHVSCPICGKSDGCLVSASDIHDPPAAVCIRPEGKKGCTSDLGDSGYLHILKVDGQVDKYAKSVLPDTDKPILIVEGLSDTLAGLSLGFVTIGRPNDKAAENLLSGMPLSGKEVWVIGDNDAGAGKLGMEKTAQVVGRLTNRVRRFLPPDGIKDLRIWYRDHGLTSDELTEYAEKYGSDTSDLNPDIFDDDQPSSVAEAFLRRNHTIDNTIILRNWKGQWYNWDQGRYVELEKQAIEGMMLRFMRDKYYTRETVNGTSVTRVPMTTKSLNDTLKNLNIWCPVDCEPPVWMNGIDDMPKPRDLIAFKNGLLDVNEYMEGRIKLYDPNPNLFILNTLPYDFDEDSACPQAEQFFNEVLNSDREVIDLLQEWFGYNLVPDTTQEKMMLLTGRPRSGKSTTLDMMKAMLGPDQVCAAQMTNLISRFGRQPMLGKLATCFGDTKTPRASEASMALETLLAIVGQDAVPVDRKNQTELPNVKMFCRFTMVMNDLPSFSDHARALAPRMNIIDYPNSYIGSEDRNLKPMLERLAKHGNLINWALEGLTRLRSNGHFTEPGSSEQIRRQFETTTTPVMAFIDECCIVGKEIVDQTGKKVIVMGERKDTVYTVWANWCKSQSRKPGMKAEFCKWVLNAAPSVDTTRRCIEGDVREQIFRGITLTKRAKELYL